jgi:hypothetical protein
VNLDTSRWDILLGEAFCKPGAQMPVTIEAATFRWADWSTPEWSAAAAFLRLQVPHLPYPADQPKLVIDGDHFSMVEGITSHAGIALNELSPNKLRTVAHELAHWLLGHVQLVTRDEHEAITPFHEFEADTVAMLVCYALNQPDGIIADCRHYVQRYQRDLTHVAGDLPTSWETVKCCATKILAAGVGAPAADAHCAVVADSARAFAERERLARIDNERRAKQTADFASRIKFAPRRK